MDDDDHNDLLVVAASDPGFARQLLGMTMETSSSSPVFSRSGTYTANMSLALSPSGVPMSSPNHSKERNLDVSEALRKDADKLASPVRGKKSKLTPIPGVSAPLSTRRLEKLDALQSALLETNDFDELVGSHEARSFGGASPTLVRVPGEVEERPGMSSSFENISNFGSTFGASPYSSKMAKSLQLGGWMNEGIQSSVSELEARIAQVKHETRLMRGEAARLAHGQDRLRPAGTFTKTNDDLAQKFTAEERRNMLEFDLMQENLQTKLEEVAERTSQIELLQKKIRLLERRVEAKQEGDRAATPGKGDSSASASKVPMQSEHLSVKELMLAPIDVEHAIREKMETLERLKTNIKAEKSNRQRLMRRQETHSKAQEKDLEDRRKGAWALWEKQQDLIFARRAAEREATEKKKKNASSRKSVSTNGGKDGPPLSVPEQALPSFASPEDGQLAETLRERSIALTDSLSGTKGKGKKAPLKRQQGETPQDDEDREIADTPSVLLLSPEDVQKSRRLRAERKKWQTEKAKRDIKQQQGLSETERSARIAVEKMQLEAMKIVKTNAKVALLSLKSTKSPPKRGKEKATPKREEVPPPPPKSESPAPEETVEAHDEPKES